MIGRATKYAAFPDVMDRLCEKKKRKVCLRPGWLRGLGRSFSRCIMIVLSMYTREARPALARRLDANHFVNERYL
jgi:hypothetical protein